MTEPAWEVVVSVPLSLDVEQRQALFEAIVATVAEWEPDDRDGWDADVSGRPTPPTDLADRMHEWADVLARGSGSVPAVDVAWKLRELTRSSVEGGSAR